jgi:hypothetical protein
VGWRIWERPVERGAAKGEEGVLATLGEVLRRLQGELGTRQDLLRDAASAMDVLFARAAHWRLEERRRRSSR